MKDYCKELETPDGLSSVQGYYDSRFERVLEEFSQNSILAERLVLEYL